MRWIVSLGLVLGLLGAGSSHERGRLAPKVGGVKKFELTEEGELVMKLEFVKGQRVFIYVESDREGDVDLVVEDVDGTEITFDERTDKNCLVTFVPTATQGYRVRVINMGPENSGTVTYSTDMFQLKELKPFDIQEGETKTFDLHFTKGEKAAVFVESATEADVDLFIKDKHGNEILADESGSKDCALTWVPTYTGIYRIEVYNLGEGANRCTVLHTGTVQGQQGGMNPGGKGTDAIQGRTRLRD